jgi:hypothetical protein
VVRFRHLAPIAACPRPNVGIARTTRNDKFRVAFLNLTFVRRDCGIGDTNVKFTPRANRIPAGDRRTPCRCHLSATFGRATAFATFFLAPQMGVQRSTLTLVAENVLINPLRVTLGAPLTLRWPLICSGLQSFSIMSSKFCQVTLEMVLWKSGGIPASRCFSLAPG